MSRRSVDRRKSRRAKGERRWAETETPRRGQSGEGQIERDVLVVPDTAPTKARRHDPHTTEVNRREG